MPDEVPPNSASDSSYQSADEQSPRVRRSPSEGQMETPRNDRDSSHSRRHSTSADTTPSHSSAGATPMVPANRDALQWQLSYIAHRIHSFADPLFNAPPSPRFDPATVSPSVMTALGPEPTSTTPPRPAAAAAAAAAHSPDSNDSSMALLGQEDGEMNDNVNVNSGQEATPVTVHDNQVTEEIEELLRVLGDGLTQIKDSIGNKVNLMVFAVLFAVLSLKLVTDHVADMLFFVYAYFAFVESQYRLLHVIRLGRTQLKTWQFAVQIIRTLSFFAVSWLLFERRMLVAVNGLVFNLLPFSPPVPARGFSESLFVCAMTDLSAKIAVVALKMLVVCIPSSWVGRRRIGCTLHIVEQTTQVYRALLPWPIWMAHFIGASVVDVARLQHSIAPLNIALLSAYQFAKMVEAGEGLWRCSHSARALCRRRDFGEKATSEDLETGANCAICMGHMTTPVKLPCSHLFCDECVTRWLVEKTTCPLCRKKVAETDAPTMRARKGYTSIFVRLC